jgi:hypothetical protein
MHLHALGDGVVLSADEAIIATDAVPPRAIRAMSTARISAVGLRSTTPTGPCDAVRPGLNAATRSKAHAPLVLVRREPFDDQMRCRDVFNSDAHRLEDRRLGDGTGFHTREELPHLRIDRRSSQPGVKYGYDTRDFSEERTSALELAYAITVHKAQGSEFGTTILILLGLLHDPAYCVRWERKLAWYRSQGVLPFDEGGGPAGTLVVTRDDERGAIHSDEIEALIGKVFGV